MGALIQELSEGVTQAAAVYNLTEQILVQNAGGQRALRGRPLGVRNAESQERNSMAERILQHDQGIPLNKSEKQSETVGKTKSCTRKPRSKYEAGDILARILSKQ